MMADGEVIEYDSINHSGHIISKSGKVRFASGGIGFKDSKSGQVLTVAKASLEKASWMRVCKDHGLRLLLTDGQVHRFDGFSESSFQELKTLFRRMYDLDLEVREMGVKGWNWGQTEFQGSNLVFSVGYKPVLEIPMSEISNTVLTAKNEVSLEFRSFTGEETGDAFQKGDQLVEMRFHIPPTSLQAGASPAGNDGDSMDVDSDPAAVFHETIKTMADIGIVSGDSIVPFHELPFLIPRYFSFIFSILFLISVCYSGRYEVDLYADFMRMHGKSYDYKILFKQIKVLFLLPKPDDVHSYFIVGLDPPIRQGQTLYPYLVMQFAHDEDLEIRLTLPVEELSKKFEGKLKPFYDAPTEDVVSNILGIVTKLDIIRESRFQSRSGASCVKASYKANEGYIYPLDESLLFVPKPATDMLYSAIALVEFSRLDGGGESASRTFDMKVKMKKGMEFSFVGIPKDEHAALDEYLKLKGIRIKNEVTQDDLLAMSGLPESSDFEDDDEDNYEKKSKKDKVKSKDVAQNEDEDSGKSLNFAMEFVISHNSFRRG
jgi:structure-specific recognition protein 1